MLDRTTAPSEDGPHPPQDRRYAVLALGVSLTPDEDGMSPRVDLDLLDEAPRYAQHVADAFTGFRYTPLRPKALLDPVDHRAAIEEAVTARDIDVLVVHIVGHGELAGSSSGKLYVLDPRGERLTVPVTHWIELIEDHPGRHRPHTLFILDVCYAGQVAVESWHTRQEVAGRRAWVLAATGARQQAFGYRLSQAAAQVLHRYRDGELRIDRSLPYIPAKTVYQEIERVVSRLVDLDRGPVQHILTSLVPSHVDLDLPFFPNPSYGEHPDLGPPVALPDDVPPEIARLTEWAGDPEHFRRRASGGHPVAREGEYGYFSGREAEVEELADWLDGGAPALCVVTGKPGVGKSALLGVLVCAAHPALRKATRGIWSHLRRRPGENDRLVVVHARRLTLDQMVRSLEQQVRAVCPDAAPPDAAAPAPGPAARLVGLLGAQGDAAPVTVVVDALDEAEEPQDIASALLVPLARTAVAEPGLLRLVVGAREEDGLRELFRLAALRGRVTDLDAVPAPQVRHGVRDYVQNLLEHDTPYAGSALGAVRRALADGMADRLVGDGGEGGEGGEGPESGDGGLEWGEFLTAGLYVHYLLVTGSLKATDRDARAARDLGGQAPRGLLELLRLDLRRHAGQRHLLPVLTALAYAQGRGMPERVLAHAARAFTPDPDPDPDTDPDTGAAVPAHELHALLDGAARFYLRRDVDVDGSTLYRLFHEGLADQLRALHTGVPS
ncbi:AAA family ATPase [Streptomyces longispororuber]|uniref:AAA family ATPase n=1 Tax=Streptomyces longispororuber TaxID=68230 RepID=UPI00210E3D60|nr:ATP-binding protein [Streptomyces longispororuber]MCQ4211663.1 ATP-binding protein [Streptomyces longispororuber]